MNARDFVEAYMKAYNEGQTMKDFCSTNNLPYGSSYSRVHQLKERGVKLPPLAKKALTINPDELNTLIEAAMPGRQILDVS